MVVPSLNFLNFVVDTIVTKMTALHTDFFADLAKKSKRSPYQKKKKKKQYSKYIFVIKIAVQGTVVFVSAIAGCFASVRYGVARCNFALWLLTMDAKLGMHATARKAALSTRLP